MNVIELTKHREKKQAQDTSLVIDGQRLKLDAVSAKIEKDIAFLEHRLTEIDKQSKPNLVVRKTYQQMLESRLSVRNWLQYYSEDQGEEQQSQQA